MSITSALVPPSTSALTPPTQAPPGGRRNGQCLPSLILDYTVSSAGDHEREKGGKGKERRRQNREYLPKRSDKCKGIIFKSIWEERVGEIDHGHRVNMIDALFGVT
ncbi:hypothetical protein M422DRAFT_48584 [Sphaerobolus stellatus SS14]|uniref:Uncharacterized protein n=1 Tax=Sphaerobolus stellatus (strain SS14) TaxID=990650 RepID=A0A0C9VSR7_SPHS4|nr:hypothetical protein M422DRAFT_48584 [Sphaerobolus stellatus SS14]